MADKFTLKKDDLVNFLQALILRDDAEQKEALLNVSDDQIKVLAVNQIKTVALRGVLNGSFVALGDLGIDSLEIAKNVSKLFKSSEIEIGKKKNKLVLKGVHDNVTLSLILREPQYILNQLDESKFEELRQQIVGNEFDLNEQEVKDIIDYTSTFKGDLELTGKGDKVILHAEENENEILAEFPNKQLNEDFTVKLPDLFVSILSVVKSDVTISVKTDKPIYIRSAKGDVIFEYIVAPIMREE